MFEIIITLRRTVVLFVCSLIQVFGAIFQGVAIGFGYCGKLLRKLSATLLQSLDEGKYAEKIKEIAETEE